MPDAAPDRKVILAALERLLAWPEIARSPQLARFLDYIVRKTIAGESQAIKAYSIAVDVFGRSADFDPQADPIVRVQARRLRSLLEDYYRHPGAGDPVRISLPTGRYVPEFGWPGEAAEVVAAAPQAAESPRWRRRWPGSWLSLAILTIAFGAVAFSIASWRQAQGPMWQRTDAVQPPRLLVSEWQNLAGEDAAVPMAAGLAIELVTDLEQFEDMAASYGSPTDTNVLPGTDYVLTGIVRPDGPVVQYSAILSDVAAGTVVWEQTIPVPEPETRQLSVLDTVSGRISLTLGSSRGPLHRRSRSLLLSGESTAGLESLYLCRLMFDLYRENENGRTAARASACYGALSDAERLDPTALAAVASLVAEYRDPSVSALEAETDRRRFAAETLERALQIDPTSAFVWQQRARLRELAGDINEARSDYKSSLQLNPAEGDTLAAYARLLVLSGNIAEAEGPSQTAVRATPEPPAWYFGAAALIALNAGEQALALTYAETYMSADRELGLAIATAAAGSANNTSAVNRYLPQLLETEAFRVKGVLPLLRERISAPVLIDALQAGLLAAGVPEAALEQRF